MTHSWAVYLEKSTMLQEFCDTGLPKLINYYVIHTLEHLCTVCPICYGQHWDLLNKA